MTAHEIYSVVRGLETRYRNGHLPRPSYCTALRRYADLLAGPAHTGDDQAARAAQFYRRRATLLEIAASYQDEAGPNVTHVRRT